MRGALSLLSTGVVYLMYCTEPIEYWYCLTGPQRIENLFVLKGPRPTNIGIVFAGPQPFEY